MATEKLVVELDAKTKKLDDKISQSDKKINKLGNTTKKTSKSFDRFTSGLGKVELNLKATVVAAIALGAAVGAMTLKASSSRKELEQFARLAKTTEENFQALSFATKQYGINAEQIADISKDIADRVGEFSAAGTGTFQDYADVMKLTKDEARDVAREFENLSSEQVIGKMVSQMETAGVSGNKMTFVLESMGNDLSKLIPLFSNNSAELKTMKDRFNDVNSTLQITSGQAEKLKEVSTTFDLLTSGMGNAATSISATIAPVVNDFFNDIIDVVPDATQTIIDFINSFLDAENITSIVAVNKEIEKSTDLIAEKTELIANTNGRNQRVQRMALKDEEDRLAALEAQLVVLKDQETLADAKRQKGGEIGGTSGATGTGTGGGKGAGTGDEIQKITDRFKTEELLLQEKLTRELEIVGENKELRLQLEDEFQKNLFDIEIKSENKKRDIEDKLAKTKSKTDDQNARDAMALAAMVFEDNKAVAAGIAFINTAQGVTKALSIQNYVGASLTAAMGAVQISAILGASKGGGSAPSVSSAAPSQEFQPETASLEISDSSSAGSQVSTINFGTDSGDDLIDAIAMALNKAQTEGRA